MKFNTFCSYLNGNPLQVLAGDEVTLQEWDTHNRLRRIEFADGTQESYVYDDEGLRRRKVKRDGSVLDFVWDGSDLLQVLAGGVVQAQFTNTPVYWSNLLSVSLGNQSHFYGFDHNSNTRLLTDNSEQISDTYLHTAFGEEKAISGTTPNPHQYGGGVGYYDDGEGRNYVRARYLNTNNGRWMNQDPIGFESRDWNLYGYAENNPVVGIDPTGLITYAMQQAQKAYAESCGFVCRSSAGHYQCSKGSVSIRIPGVHKASDHLQFYNRNQRTIARNCTTPTPTPIPVPVPVPVPKKVPSPKKKKGKRYSVPPIWQRALAAVALVVVGAVVVIVVLDDGTIVGVADDGALVPLSAAAASLVAIIIGRSQTK